tara:strand:- start:1443 stop:2207 length:765 start_codon:yes stop_codon:yes gene_type:complete
MNPYKDTFLNRNTRIRRFKQNVSSEELVWHRDRSDRVVKIVEGSGWQLQMDNGLPEKLVAGKEYHIPANNYHRLIKGKTDLVAEIKEDKMKITRRQLRKIIEEARGYDDDLEDYYEERRLMDMDDRARDVPQDMMDRVMNLRRGDLQDHMLDLVDAYEAKFEEQEGGIPLSMLVKNLEDAERMDESRINERRMATDVFKIVTRALNQGPKTHQQLLANILDMFPNTSDEEIDDQIDKLEDSGHIIFDPTTQKYR